MKSSYGPLPMSRPEAETIPAVTVPPSPKGLPTASTQSPIRGLPSDNLANGKFEPPSTLISARSVRASVPITLALKVLPSSVVTSTLSAPSTTWLLVTAKPSAEMKKPEPWPVTAPRPRGIARRPGGRSPPPKRRKKRSIGDPGWNGEASSLLLLSPLSFLATFSLILTFTEITDGLTRSTMSAKPIGWATLRTSLLTCAWALVVKTSTGPDDEPKP